jgi:hypothetical protein
MTPFFSAEYNSGGKMLRREFLKSSSLAAGATMVRANPLSALQTSVISGKLKSIRIKGVDSNFEREPLIRPFGFKGGFMSEIWQTATLMESESGHRKVGLCTQNVLWSDSAVFAAQSESGGNALMYALAEYALKRLKGQSFQHPIQLLDDTLGDVLEYGKKVTGNPGLRKTFALNALVGFDNAAWLIYAAEHGIDDFDALIPEKYKPALSHRNERVISAPSIAFTIPVAEIKQAADDGFFFIKIKLGQPGAQDEMLRLDMERLTQIHKTIGHYETSHTENGKLPYYFDMNGRYQNKETLMRLIDHSRKIGAFGQIAVLEEPFPEDLKIDVSDIPLRLAADEAAHTDEDALERIQMGYKSIALKAIAKTLSMTMKIAQVAHEHNIPCFCADLTVNPILQDWNKNIAARLSPLPGVKGGLMEANGHQNYKNWEKMKSYHPRAGAMWTTWKDGAFPLNDEFYRSGGGIFLPSGHYDALFGKA